MGKFQRSLKSAKPNQQCSCKNLIKTAKLRISNSNSLVVQKLKELMEEIESSITAFKNQQREKLTKSFLLMKFRLMFFNLSLQLRFVVKGGEGSQSGNQCI